MSFNLIPNVLDEYTQYGYHFRFFMLPEAQTLKKIVPPPDGISEDYIIAETGGSSKTGASIEDVSFTSYGGIDMETGLGVSTDYNIQIVQSLGATLIDSIYDTAKQLGIKNVQKVPFFLELTFRVRDPNSQDPLGWTPLAGYRWVWPLVLHDTKMKVTSSGSTYNFKAAFFDSVGLYKENADLDFGVEIDAETVGEFFDELGDVMSNPEGDLEKDIYDRKKTYTFIVDPKIAELEIGQTDRKDNEDDKDTRMNSFDELPILSFSAGTSIDSIVFDVLTGTDFFQAEIAANKDSDETNEPKATIDKSKLFKKLFRVVQSVELGEWNEQLKEYNKDFIYEIAFYESSTHMSSPSDPDIIRGSIGDYIGRGVLKKEYNYIFTGENNAVINFDFNLNFNWYLALPPHGGYTLENVTHELPPRDNDARNEEPEEELCDATSNDDNEFPMGGHPVYDQQMTNTSSLETTGRNLISTLFEQQFSPTSGDLISVDIQIKGDPFWIEPDPLPGGGKAPDYIGRAPRRPTDTSNNSTGTQTFFIFTMFLPQEVDQSTGQIPPPSTKNIINGIYSTRKVVHNFSKGMFTQTLTAVRDPHLNVNSILASGAVVSTGT